MWLAAFGSEAELKDFVFNPEDVVANREETILGYSDPVLYWAKVSANKELFFKSEAKKSTDRFRRAAAKDQASQKLDPVGPVDNNGMSQLRGNRSSGAEKFMIDKKTGRSPS